MGYQGYMDAAAVPVPDAGDDTLRVEMSKIAQRVITEHEPRRMGCVCGAEIGDDIDRRWHLVNRAMAAATEHIAAAVQAERERAETAEAEVESLTDWKESAMTVMSGLQDLGKELGLPLGESITGTLAAETANRLRSRAEKAEAAIERVRYVIDSHLHHDAGGITWVQIPVGALHRALDGPENP